MKAPAEVKRLQQLVYGIAQKRGKGSNATIEQFFKRPLKYVTLNEYWELLEKAVKMRRGKQR